MFLWGVGHLMKLERSFMPSKSVISCPWFERWNITTNYTNLRFHSKWAPLVTCWIIDSFPSKFTNSFSFLACWLLKLMKFSFVHTSRYACLAFWQATCFYKPSNLGTRNFSQCSITLQTLHLTILNLPSSPITTFAHNNLAIQICWNIQLNSHSIFWALLGVEPLGDGASTN
jgi:hypothetical protein